MHWCATPSESIITRSLEVPSPCEPRGHIRHVVWSAEAYSPSGHASHASAPVASATYATPTSPHDGQ